MIRDRSTLDNRHSCEYVCFPLIYFRFFSVTDIPSDAADFRVDPFRAFHFSGSVCPGKLRAEPPGVSQGARPIHPGLRSWHPGLLVRHIDTKWFYCEQSTRKILWCGEGVAFGFQQLGQSYGLKIAVLAADDLDADGQPVLVRPSRNDSRRQIATNRQASPE